MLVLRRSMGCACVLAACGGGAAEAPSAPTAIPTATAASAASAAPSATSTPTSTPAAPATSPPVPSGGSVLLGEVTGPKGFDPMPTLVAFQPQLVSCYNQARAANAALHGKIKLRVEVNEKGAVLTVASEPGGSANDPTLVACVGDAFKSVSFPKPAGTATMIVPMVFRP